MTRERHREAINLDAWPVHVQQWTDQQIRERGLDAMPTSGRERFAHVTAQAVADALDGFRLPIVDGRDVEWLSRALRKTLALATPLSVALGDCAQPNSLTRTNLLAAAPKLERAAAALGDLTELDLAPVAAAMKPGPLGVYPFRKMRAELGYLAECFRATALHLPVLQGPARAAAARELAIRRAFYLGPLFTMAYGAKATANDYPGADPGPWPDWFARIIFAATGDRIPDLRKVLKEARARHLDRGVEPLTYDEAWLTA